MTAIRRAARATGAALLFAAALAPAAFSAPLPPSGTLTLPGEADLTLTGERGTRAGAVVAPAGDFNGDGHLDLLVGDPGANPARRESAGTVYVVFGPLTSAPASLAQLGDRGLRIDGPAAGDRLGTAAAGAGDVNGDGLGDVILGAPRSDDDPGSAYVVLGRRESGQVDLANRGGGELRLSLGGTHDHAGATVGSVPDMDGDDRRELLVGADRAGFEKNANVLPPGAAFVVFAKAATGDIDLANLGDRGIRLDGAPGSGAGLGLAGAPDVNGDGRGDVLVGAPTFGARAEQGTTARPRPQSGPGRAYVVFGTPTPGRVDLANLGGAGITVTAAPGDGFLGISPFALGDLTGDGVPDMAFGSPFADRNERDDSGSVHVVAGQREAGTIDLGAANRRGFRIDGGVADDRLGTWIDAVPDVDGDGRSELLLAAQGADAESRTDAGAAYVVFGDATLRDLDVSGLRERGYRVAGPSEQSALGSVTGLGDLDGDGRGDYAVGAGGASTAHLILGPKPPLVPPPPPDPGVAEEVAAGCIAATNIEVVIDDSGSMAGTDPLELARQATELLITKPRSEGKVIGVFEFGSEGAQIIAPTVVVPRGVTGSNKPEMLAALTKAIGADNGGTNYNIGLKGAADDNPAAQARLFITDGAHNEGEYTEQHRGGPPTYVIGLGEESDESTFRRRLRRIASETKGRAFTGVTARDIVAVVNQIDSRLNCDVELDTDIDRLTEDDRVEEQVVDLDPAAHTLDVEVSWGDEREDVEPAELAFLDEDEDVVARISGRRLREVIARPGRTFTISGIELKGTARRGRFGLRLTGRPAEQLRVRYRATRVRGKLARVTSQVSQSRRRAVQQVGA